MARWRDQKSFVIVSVWQEIKRRQKKTFSFLFYSSLDKIQGENFYLILKKLFNFFFNFFSPLKHFDKCLIIIFLQNFLLIFRSHKKLSFLQLHQQVANFEQT